MHNINRDIILKYEKCRKFFPESNIKISDYENPEAVKKVNKWERNENVVCADMTEATKANFRLNTGLAMVIFQKHKDNLGMPKFSLEKNVDFQSDSAEIDVGDGETKNVAEVYIEEKMKELGVSEVMNSVWGDTILYGDGFLSISDKGEIAKIEIDQFFWDIGCPCLARNQEKAFYAGKIHRYSTEQFFDYFETLSKENGWKYKEKELRGEIPASQSNPSDFLEQMRKNENENRRDEEENFVEFIEYFTLRDKKTKKPARYIVVGTLAKTFKFKDYPFEIKGKAVLPFGKLSSFFSDGNRYSISPVDLVVDGQIALNKLININIEHAYRSAHSLFFAPTKKMKEITESFSKPFNDRICFYPTKDDEDDDVRKWLYEFKTSPMSVDLERGMNTIYEIMSVKSEVDIRSSFTTNAKFATEIVARAESTAQSTQRLADINETNGNIKRIIEQIVARITDELERKFFEENTKFIPIKNYKIKKSGEDREALQNSGGEIFYEKAQAILSFLKNSKVEITEGGTLRTTKVTEFSRKLQNYLQLFQLAMMSGTGQAWTEATMENAIEDLLSSKILGINEKNVRADFARIREQAEKNMERRSGEAPTARPEKPKPTQNV